VGPERNLEVRPTSKRKNRLSSFVIIFRPVSVLLNSPHSAIQLGGGLRRLSDEPFLEHIRQCAHHSVSEQSDCHLCAFKGMVWSSPERHGAMTGLMKSQIDWIPLSLGSMRPTQGKTLAVMQVCGGSQSFNMVNQLRILGRWMRLLTIPNQSSVARVWDEFDEAGQMKPSPYYNRIVDVMEELVKLTLLTRDIRDHLTDRYSERVESHAELSIRVNQAKST